MPDFAINHMTTPHVPWRELLALSTESGCMGVEFRNDLETPLFSGEAPEIVAAEVRRMGLRIVGLSQVYPFNSWSDAIAEQVAALISTATACGAETINLIPRNDGTETGDGERQANLRLALREIRPMLQDAGMTALVEPLGFERSSLRTKAEAIEAIEAVASREEFLLVHDTFHHFVAGEEALFPEWTGIVHISGVSDQDVAVNEMEDAHRTLVDGDDRLGNVAQIEALLAGGYRGPVSFECFSPQTHALTDPASEIKRSLAFITSRLQGRTT